MKIKVIMELDWDSEEQTLEVAREILEEDWGLYTSQKVLEIEEVV
jgi:ABC-type proline/glycine betaine transport system substrate-binding protein